MSEEKQALERLKGTLLAESYDQDVLQDVAIIDGALTILEIIKKKRVNAGILQMSNTWEGYGCIKGCLDGEWLTQEEFDLLKSWLTQK